MHAAVAVIYDEPDLRVSDLSLEALMEDITASVRVTDSSPHKDIKSCTLRSGLDASDESPEVRTLLEYMAFIKSAYVLGSQLRHFIRQKQLDCLSQSPVLNVMPLQQKKELLSHLDALDWVELPRNELSTLIMTFKACFSLNDKSMNPATNKLRTYSGRPSECGSFSEFACRRSHSAGVPGTATFHRGPPAPRRTGCAHQRNAEASE